MTISPEVSGGGGFTFEDVAVAIYLGALLGEETAPGLRNRTVTRVAVQQAGFGEPLDDLIVDGIGQNWSRARLSLQVKRGLTISAAATNTDFREIVTRAWATLSKPDFRENTDQVGAVTGTVAEEPRRALNDLCEWARGSLSVESFLARFQPGAASDQHRAVLNAYQTILPPLPSGAPDDSAVLRLLRHFILIKIDALHAGATDESHPVERLRGHLHDPSQAESLWDRLRVIAREAAGRATEFSRPALLTALHGRFRLEGAWSLRGDLDRVNEETRNALATIGNQIDGVDVERASVIAEAQVALESHRFVHIVGLPGTGKSAVLRACVEHERKKGTSLLLKSDRLSGHNWASYAQTLGLIAVSIEPLLCEIAATGSSIMFIDGIDRVEVKNRGIILDLLNTILGSPELAGWRIIATSRDNGIEPLRTWLPVGFFDGSGVGSVSVGPFDDDEATQLAEKKPGLRRLLFGERRVRAIARRPFFAAVLARGLARADGRESAPPTSEVELIDAWWSRGGYDSDDARIYHRQRALIQLAKAGAGTLGRRIVLDGLDLDALQELRKDDIVRDVSAGHTVQFAHDIFFEWSLLHLLIEHGENWVEQIRALGEPPVLGRTVELLSQVAYADFETWQANLRRLETTPVRPQWMRAWVTAPFSSPRFWNQAERFTEAMLCDGAKRLAQLAVWFQAEKTQANPNILDRSLLPQPLSRSDIVRYADALAWPADLATWSRFLRWVLRNSGNYPATSIPDIVSAFEVWQNLLADRANAVSNDIIAIVSTWLQDLEDREHGEEFRFDHGPWEPLGRGERNELEDRLRNILLRSARVEIDRVRGYIKRVQGCERLRHHVFGKLIGWTPTLATHHAQDVVELMLADVIDELPADLAARPDDLRMLSRSFSVHDWHELAIRDPGGEFFPASPLREPFASLFQTAPAEALVLVRRIINHAITAWRQLHDLTRAEQGTPIPLTLDFPWGQQEFWGDSRVYMWSRGQWAPPPVSSGLMALEKWAFDEVSRGRGVDDIIRDVVTGHQSCSVLNIALAVALESNHVSAVTLPLATSQRVWNWDVGRYASESSVNANFVGFMRPSHLPHAEAVRAANNRPARRLEVRFLAQLFVLNKDEKLRTAAQEAIRSFPDSLPFEVEEEKQHDGRVASLARTAEIWSHIGNIETYSTRPAPDGSGILIQHENPTASDPDVVEVTERSARLSEHLRLLNWVEESFKEQKVSDRLSMSDALASARKLDRTDLFKTAHGKDHEADRIQGAVAGVAAIATLYAGPQEASDEQWLSETLLRAAQTPEYGGGLWFSGAALLFHSGLYAAKGLPGLVRRGLEPRKAQLTLLELAGHPLEEVSQAALRGALSLWDVDANFAWLALDLGIRLSTASRETPPDPHDPVKTRERLAANVEYARHASLSGKLLDTLPDLPQAWVFAPWPGKFWPGMKATKPVWREPDVFLRWDFLPKILPAVPVEAAIIDPQRGPAFLTFCDGLLHWMLERLAPSWETEKPKRRERRAEPVEWRHDFMQFLARVALQLDAPDVHHRVLDRIFALEDELAASLIHPFVDWVTTIGIFDAPSIAPRAITLTQACLGRTLKDRAWKHARGRDGRLYGFDVPQLVRIYLFVSIEFAGGAARFANRDWREIGAVLPIVDRLVRQVGDIPDVMSGFLTLCERAAEHYPAAIFVEQVTAATALQERTPIGWRNSTIPSRIAGLVHTFAEREQPLPQLAQAMLRVLDKLVDMGDRRSAALQTSEIFKDVRL
jgi:hypothetical protein